MAGPSDPIFKLKCDDCDEQGLLSRLWLRASVDVETRKGGETHHYVECMNCGARLKSRFQDLMEEVDDDEWRRFVGDVAEESGHPGVAAPGAARGR